jgi:hypothetical protein
MADPVTLVILVAAGEAASPGASAMAQGARDAFAGTVAAVHETRAAPTDADAMGIEEESHPDAVAELIWRDADHRRATLRVHLRRSARWVERSFTFGPSDPAAERGRTLGFAVAAILPEVAVGTGASAPASASPTATATTSASAPATASGPPTAPATASGAPTAPATASGAPTAPASATSTAPASAPAPATASGPAPAPATSTAPPSSPARSSAASGADSAEQAPFDGGRSPRIGLDLLGEAATGIGASAATEGTEGGGAAIEWFLHRQLSVRLGAVVRAGAIDVAAAHTTTVVTSAGLVLQPWQTTPSQPFGVTLRADYILVRESMTHDDSDDLTPVQDARWLSGVDTFFDGQLVLSTQIAAVAGIGLEDVWSPTYVLMHNVNVATLPALRVVGEAGFQLRF